MSEGAGGAPLDDGPSEAGAAAAAGRRDGATYPALAVAGVLAPFLPVVFGVRTLVAHDSQRLYAPLRGFVVEALRAGRLPLWNPYEAAGVPLFAEALHGVLHPVSLAAAWLAPGAGLDAVILLYLAVAAAGGYAAARAVGAGPPAALVGALAYGLAGHTVSMAANLLYLAGLASAPWIVATMARAGAEARSRWTIPAVAVAVACGAFAGEFQALAWSVVLGSALAAAAGGLRGLARAAAGTALGALLAAIQLVPSWVYLQRTTRAEPVDGMPALQWPFEPWRVVEWIVPGFFDGRLGRGESAPFLLLGGPTAFPTPFTQSVFIGSTVLALAAAAAGASSASARTRRVLLVAAGIALWLALGHRLGATQLSTFVPVLGSLRFPEKWLAPLVLSAAVLAALGAERVAAEGAPRWLSRTSLGALGVVAAAWLAVAVVPGVVERFLGWAGGGQESQPMVRLPADAAGTARAHLADGLPHATLALGAASTLLALSRRRRPRWLVPALAALVGLEGAAATPFASRFERRVEPGEGLIASLRGAEPVPRVIVPYLDADHSLPRVPASEDGVAVAARLGLAPMNVPARVDNLELYSGLFPRRWNNLAVALGDDRWRAWRRFASTHAVVPRPMTPGDAELASRATEGGALVAEDVLLGATVWTLPHRPWAFFAEACVTLPTPYDVHDRLLAAIGADDPTVFVETREPVVTGPGVVRRVHREAERLRVEAEAPGDALLVIGDAYLPGWSATIDGRPAEVLPADILVRAVRWPAGRHVLEMRYDPPEVRCGRWVSLAGLLLLAAVALRPIGGAPSRSTGAPA